MKSYQKGHRHVNLNKRGHKATERLSTLLVLQSRPNLVAKRRAFSYFVKDGLLHSLEIGVKPLQFTKQSL